MIKKNKKNNPPIHCDDDLHNIKVGSKYFIFLKILILLLFESNPSIVDTSVDSLSSIGISFIPFSKKEL